MRVALPLSLLATLTVPFVSACGADGTTRPSSAALELTASQQRVVDHAEDRYAAFVGRESDRLLAATVAFADAYATGDDTRARALYPDARVHWERIETVAESFGDLDPQLDAREADVEAGEEWTGWHRLEKDLWPERDPSYRPLTDRERAGYADELVADTRELHGRIAALSFTVGDIADGSRGLLEEVATGKVTGEEEYWSRTDLWDFQANVDGARVGFEGVEPLLAETDPGLADELRRRFAELQALLDRHRTPDGFVRYDELSAAQVQQLADAVGALSEPLSRLSAAVDG